MAFTERNKARYRMRVPILASQNETLVYVVPIEDVYNYLGFL